MDHQTRTLQARNLIPSLQQSALAALMVLTMLFGSLLAPLPAMAIGSNHTIHTDHSIHTITLATMSNKASAAAKGVEGKLESAYGELTGDTGHQIKGKAKQVQGSAMNTAEDLKESAKSVAKKVGDAIDKVGQ
jgi:uncharacterized protein YjbJ (UPF0337 family)